MSILLMHVIVCSVYIVFMPIILLTGCERLSSQSEIPEIVAYDENGTAHRGQQGSYCWNGICQDKQLSLDNTESPKIQLQSHSIITFEVKSNVKAQKLHATIFDIHNFPSGISLDHEVTDNKLSLDVPAGNYILTVMATWQGKGDVSYAFPLEITEKKK